LPQNLPHIFQGFQGLRTDISAVGNNQKKYLLLPVFHQLQTQVPAWKDNLDRKSVHNGDSWPSSFVPRSVRGKNCIAPHLPQIATSPGQK
jgi:hypothetical protein